MKTSPIKYAYVAFLLMAIWACAQMNQPHDMNSNNYYFTNDIVEDLCNGENSILPNSIGLPLVQDIPGFRNHDSLIHYLQSKADTFSWESFIALNWKATPEGKPDTTACFGDDGITVWEHWMPASHIYRPKDEPPFPWQEGVAQNGTPLNSDHHKALRFLAKADDFTNLTPEDAAVIDQEKMYTLYGIYYNKTAYNYVVESELETKDGQEKFIKNWPNYTAGLEVVSKEGDTMNIQERFKRAYFPVGNRKDSTEVKGDNTYIFSINDAPIIIKSAWRSIPLGEEHLYHKRHYTVGKDSIIALGLVGMHFIHKVSESTQWVWSTFEHKMNAPGVDKNGEVVLESSMDYKYFIESQIDTNDFNRPTHKRFERDIAERQESQIVKLNAAYQIAENLNAYYHNEIVKVNKNSVWQYYQLVGTQWPFETELFTAGGDYHPKYLANAVMETFKQRGASCMGCHKSARFMKGDNTPTGFNSDFIFTLDNAQ